jgi:hypothetical protein
MIPGDVDAATVERILLRVSAAMQQKGYFAARPASEPTGRWALEVNMGAGLSAEQYRNIIESVSRDATLFNGTTIIALKPASFVIVVNEGVTAEQVDAEAQRIANLFPRRRNVTFSMHQVEVVEGYNEEGFRQDLSAGRDARRLDREAAARRLRQAAEGSKQAAVAARAAASQARAVADRVGSNPNASPEETQQAAADVVRREQAAERAEALSLPAARRRRRKRRSPRGTPSVIPPGPTVMLPTSTTTSPPSRRRRSRGRRRGFPTAQVRTSTATPRR